MTYNKDENKTTRPVGRPKGYPMSEEHKRIISKANSGSNSYIWGRRGDDHPLWGNEELREKAARKIGTANSVKNRRMKMMHNGDEKRVPYDQIEQHLEDGWIFKAKKINVNNGERNKLINPKDWYDYIDEGWEWGSLSTLKVD